MKKTNGTVVGKIDEKRKPGYLYYVKGQNVIRKPMSWMKDKASRARSKARKITKKRVKK